MHPPTQSHYSQNAHSLVRDYLSADATELHVILGRWLPVGGRVLEIGCGAGRDAAFMASRGHKLVASDASAEMQDNPPGNPSSMRRAYRLLLEDTKLRPPRTVPQRNKPKNSTLNGQLFIISLPLQKTRL